MMEKCSVFKFILLAVMAFLITASSAFASPQVCYDTFNLPAYWSDTSSSFYLNSGICTQTGTQKRDSEYYGGVVDYYLIKSDWIGGTSLGYRRASGTTSFTNRWTSGIQQQTKYYIPAFATTLSLDTN